MVRKAKPEDIPQIFRLAVSLINSIRIISEATCFAKDPQQLVDGLVEMITAKVEAEIGHLVLVDENEDGSLHGFLVGCIHTIPRFYEHHILGQVEVVYPLSFRSSEMVRMFDTWARVRGASARTCLCPAKHVSGKAFEKHGKMELVYEQYIKEYPGE